jgi:hypothetical protein
VLTPRTKGFFLEKKMDKYVEKIANGLRKTNNPPDYLVFIDRGDGVFFDRESILGIPVLYTGWINYCPCGEESYFLPVWKDAEKHKENNMTYFERGYTEG